MAGAGKIKANETRCPKAPLLRPSQPQVVSPEVVGDFLKTHVDLDKLYLGFQKIMVTRHQVLVIILVVIECHLLLVLRDLMY